VLKTYSGKLCSPQVFPPSLGVALTTPRGASGGGQFESGLPFSPVRPAPNKSCAPIDEV